MSLTKVEERERESEDGDSLSESDAERSSIAGLLLDEPESAPAPSSFGDVTAVVTRRPSEAFDSAASSPPAATAPAPASTDAEPETSIVSVTVAAAAPGSGVVVVDDAGPSVGPVVPAELNSARGKSRAESRSSVTRGRGIVSVIPIHGLRRDVPSLGDADAAQREQRRRVVSAESPEATHAGAERTAALLAASTLDPRVLWAGVMQVCRRACARERRVSDAV